MINDTLFMRRAIELARRGEGLTRPNPPVGAVVVKSGRIVGEGWHRKAGGPHAEILALRQAGEAARGATLYVTLEPCCTHGRTPPCTDAVLAAGIRRVVAACRDPNPRHAGRGLRLLKRRGLDVVSGVAGGEAGRLVEPFAKWITRRRPFVTLKLAVTLDGRIADAEGRSRWITGEASRKRVQALRRRADAILTGVNTVNADDPSLLPRPARGRRPWRVVVDTRGRVNPDARIFHDEAAGRTMLATTAEAGAALAHVILPGRKNGRVDLAKLLQELAALDILHVVCEGGGQLAASLLGEKLVDELWLFVAPRILGGGETKPAVGGAGWMLKQAPVCRIVSCERVGEDVLLIARPQAGGRKAEAGRRRTKGAGRKSGGS